MMLVETVNSLDALFKILLRFLLSDLIRVIVRNIIPSLNLKGRRN